MLSNTAIVEAGDLIWSLWTGGEVVSQLPAPLRPGDRADGYRIQARLEGRSRLPLFGWKIAGTNPTGRAHIGIGQPIAGRILAERVLGEGATASLTCNRLRVAEAEFAFRMGATLPPRAHAYAVEEVMASVDSLHPAIEIPDTRLTDFVVAGEAQLIADNACGHEFVLGRPAPTPWRDLDLTTHRVRCTTAAGHVNDGIGSNVLGDPRLALTWLANELSRLDIALQAGQIVTTGTVTTPLPVVAGDRVLADFGPLGSVEISFG